MVFAIFPILFFLFFAVFLVILLGVVVRAAKQNMYNRSQPVLSVSARVLARRTNLGSHRTSSAGHSVNTSYHVTFEVESGDRMEFAMPGNEFGLLVEGDYGKLTFQGQKYLGFIRDARQTPFHMTEQPAPTGKEIQKKPPSPVDKNQTYPDS